MLTVRDILRSKPDAIWSVSPDTSTIDALSFLKDRNVGALLVLEDGLIVGIISERDFVHRIAQDRACDLQMPVSEYMTTSVITVSPDFTIEECMQVMTNKRIRHLPVVHNGALVGLVSIGDLVKAIISDQSLMIDNLEDYILGRGHAR